jgi:hypothetical protein
MAHQGRLARLTCFLCRWRVRTSVSDGVCVYVAREFCRSQGTTWTPLLLAADKANTEAVQALLKVTSSSPRGEMTRTFFIQIMYRLIISHVPLP